MGTPIPKDTVDGPLLIQIRPAAADVKQVSHQDRACEEVLRESSDRAATGTPSAARCRQTSIKAALTASTHGPRTIPDTPKTARPPMNASRVGTGCIRIRSPAAYA